MTREEIIRRKEIEKEAKERFGEWPLNMQFVGGAEWADENPNEQMIAKYLYENKGYPIDLNGNLPSFEETMKDVELYNEHKKKKLIDKACDFIRKNFKNDYQGKGEPVVRTYYSFVESIIEDLTKAMEE